MNHLELLQHELYMVYVELEAVEALVKLNDSNDYALSKRAILLHKESCLKISIHNAKQ